MQPLLNSWLAIGAGRGGKAEMQGAKRSRVSPTPVLATCARAVYSGWGQPSGPRPSLREKPRPCGRGLRSGLWLRPPCSSGGGGRGQRGSFPCCVCRCLLAILLQSLFLSAGLPGAAGREASEGGREGGEGGRQCHLFFLHQFLFNLQIIFCKYFGKH